MEQNKQNILRELFNVYEPKIESHPMTKEERAVWDKAQALLGGDMLDEMLHTQCRSIVEAHYDYFREGFRLGARLMLELK